MVAVVETRQVEQVAVAVECCLMGRRGWCWTWWCGRSGRGAVNTGVQIMEDVERKVEGHDVAVAMWSRDPNLGVAVCGERRWMRCDWLWMEEGGSKSWWWNGSSGGRIQV